MSNPQKITTMKKMMLMAVLMTIVVSASAMSYTRAKSEAKYMSDKMARELRLTKDQYASVCKINLNYLLSVDEWGRATKFDKDRRDTALRNVLTVNQYAKYKAGRYYEVRIADKGNFKTGGRYSNGRKTHHFSQR